MKTIILHGDDERRLYLRLQKFIETARERSWEVVYLDETGAALPESLSAASLFSKERFFVLKDARKIGKKEAEWLKKKSVGLQGTLIIYSEGYVPKAVLDTFPAGVKVEEFKLPVIIWSFLEQLYPGNSERSIRDFHKVIEREAPEFIFTLIAKLFRDLYWVKVDPSSIPYPSWRTSKLKRQSDRFTGNQLRDIIKDLARIDVEAKTSKSDLASELDLMMIKQLE